MVWQLGTSFQACCREQTNFHDEVVVVPCGVMEGEVLARDFQCASETYPPQEEKLDMSMCRDHPLCTTHEDGISDLQGLPAKDSHVLPGEDELKDKPCAKTILEYPADAKLSEMKERSGIHNPSGSTEPIKLPTVLEPAKNAQSDVDVSKLMAQAAAKVVPQSTVKTPRGEYAGPENRFDVKLDELMRLEALVAKLAGSPLGCIDFVKTFQQRQAENQILVLKGHSLDGKTFGDVCSKYRRITVLGLRNSSGTINWAPDHYIRIHASDDVLLIECTPFALAMGLAKEATLAESRMLPRTSPPSTPGSYARSPDQQQQVFNQDLDLKQRRCCGGV